MADELNLSMFRGYDIRTPATRLSDPLARRLAEAEAVYFRRGLGVPGVVVGHDARRTGPRYLAIAIEAFRRAGLEVIYVPGPCSTSYLYYCAMRYPRHAAVSFGASHNPARDTGQKLLAPGLMPIAEHIGVEGGLTKIRQLYLDGAAYASPAPGPIRVCEAIDDYIRYSMRRAGVAPGGLRGVPLLHDYLYGSAGREMMLAFARAEADLLPLHFIPDGDFPLGSPNPILADVIRPGLDALRGGRFQCGLFFDGDGDRIDVYRGDGAYLASSFVYAAILPDIAARFPGPGMGVFADLRANPAAVIEMARCGVAVDYVRSGHSLIKKSLHDDPRRFGAVEESAHFYEAFADGGAERYCTENTLYFALLLARTWRDDPPRFDRLLAIQGTTVRQREWGYQFPGDAQRADALAAVIEHFAAQGAEVIQRMRNGVELKATLMRMGLPTEVQAGTELRRDWLQVCQRSSQSENGLARWEVIAADAARAEEARRAIEAVARRFGAGEVYQG